MSLIQRIKKLLTDTRPPEPDDLVKIRTFDTAGEAYVAKSLLASNGIPAMVSNEAEIYSPQIRTGIRLLIFYRDWDTATSLLDGKA